MVMGKIYKKDGEFKFQAVGEGKNGDINTIVDSYYN
jgi:stress response protein SCP2